MNKVNAIYISILALIVAAVALVMCIVCCNKTPTKQVLSQEEVAAVLNTNPEMILNALQNQEQIKRTQEQKEAEKALAANIEEINNYAASPVLGNPEGKVTVVEFFDFACHYCHDLTPKLMNVVKQDGDVRLVLKPLYFLSPTSDYAARVLYVAADQGKAQEFYEAVMTTKGQLTKEAVDQFAIIAGLDMEKVKAEVNSAKINKAMADTGTLAQNIKISGVPTMVIGGKIVQTLDEGVIKQQVNAAK